MGKPYIILVLSFLLLLGSSFKETTILKNDNQDLTEARGDWEINPELSSVKFKIGAIWLLRVRGTMGGLEGTISIEDPLENSVVTLSLKPETINTESEPRDQHLRSPDFFDVAKYPLITYEATTIIDRGSHYRYIAKGELTMKDVTRKLGIYFDFDGIEKTETTELVFFSGEVKINRRDYNIDFTGKGVNDIATVSFTIVADRIN